MQASLCCVRTTCDEHDRSLAQQVLKSTCGSLNMTPPDIENMNCATDTISSKIAPRTSSTVDAAATSSTSGTPSAEKPSDSASKIEPEHGNSPNVAMIAGVLGGVVAIILILAVWYFFFRRKRKITRQTTDANQKESPPKEASTLEVVMMSKLSPSHTSLPTSLSQNSPAGSSYSPLGNHHSAELGIQGARPHGFELGSTSLIPPRPELQGMTFATRNRWPTELPVHEDGGR